MLFKKFQQLAQWVGFLTIAALALYGFVTLGSGRAWAEGNAPAAITIPSTFNYQGFLRDAQGNSITGTRKIKVSLWSAVTGPTELYSETFTGVSVRDGLFNVVMGSTQNMDPGIFQNNVPLFVGVTVDDATEELLPRQRIHPVPWAILATSAQNATTATTATTAGTATTLVPNAAVPGLNVTTSLRTGNVNGLNIYIDEDDIQARSGNSIARLDLNFNGGDVVIGNASSDLYVRGNTFVKGKGVVVGEESNLRIVRGTGSANVPVDGANLAPYRGAGFTFKKISQGVVDVTFNTAFGGDPTVTANAMGGGSVFTHVMGIGGGTNYWPGRQGFRIIMYDTNGNGRDWAFNFIAIGPAGSSVAAAGADEPKQAEQEMPAAEATGQ